MPATKVEKSKWLKLGIKKFSTRGVQGVNVEQMSKKLNCNKSSFYWHFKSKEKFLNEMILYWFENSTKPVKKVVIQESNPKERFKKFLIQSFKDTSRKDLMYHLRILSKTDSKVKELLSLLNSKRLTYISSLIQDLDYSKKEAELKAEILLNFYIGWYETNKNETYNSEKKIEHAIGLIKNFINF